MSNLPPRRQPALLAARVLAALLVLVIAYDPGVQASAASVSRHHSSQHHPHQPHHPHAGRHQELTLHVLPGVSQVGPHVAPSGAARHVLAVDSRPRAAGRPVSLQRRVRGTWHTVATRRTDARGHVEVFLPVSRRPSAHGAAHPTYRVKAERWRGYAPTTSAPVRDQWRGPDFVDEFDAGTLGPAWEHRISFYNPWGGRACSKGSPDAVTVADGSLRLSSMVDPERTDLCAATDQKGRALGQFPYRLNGHVSTQHSADFKYGVAAARMRFPRSLGQHAAFWLQPRGLLTTGTTPWGAEVDVVEWYGSHQRRSRMASAVHEPMPDGAKRQIGGHIPRPERLLRSRPSTWWSQFHVFSVEWTPREYIFRVDGHELWRTHEGVSHSHEFLILSMLSSDFELPHVGTDPTPRTAEVDWVAFWQA